MKHCPDLSTYDTNVAVSNAPCSFLSKEKIAAIEADHTRSLSMLRSQYQAAKQETEQWKTRLELVRQNNLENEKEPSPVTFSNESNRDDLPWTHAERQQGEVMIHRASTENAERSFHLLGI